MIPKKTTLAAITLLILSGGGLYLNSQGEREVAKPSLEPITTNEESLFAQINPDTGEVLQVIVITEELINTGLWGNPAHWVRTYADGRDRGKMAGVGELYLEEYDAFIQKKPYDSWVLDEVEVKWKAPVEQPKNGKLHSWNEREAKWQEVTE